MKRISVAEMEPPTKAYLFELHRAHVSNVPWETVDIFAGRSVSIDVKESVQLIINRRSGYCFHLNGAFSTLLRSLGYKVSWHRAGVQPLGEEPRVNSFHLGLTVDLANESQKEEKWIVDVGLGDMPFEPLPLQTGVYKQGPLVYKVMESAVVDNGWRLEHDSGASFAGVDFAPEVIYDMNELKPKHDHYCQSTESPWINLFLIRQRHAEGSNELRGCIWSKRDSAGIEKTEIRTKSQWLEVLGNIFGEHLVRYSSRERDDLWKKVQKKHEEWKQAKAL